MLSAPESLCNDVSQLLADFGTSGPWRLQTQAQNCYQLSTTFSLRSSDVPVLVSRLARFPVIAELGISGQHSAEIYFLHPALGIHRQQLDETGEVVLRAGMVEHLLEQSAGNLADFRRALRRLDGTLWQDLMEPYRRENEKVVALHRFG